MTRSPNRLLELRRLGQSPWCDQLSRHLLESGELERLVDLGVVGLTSNPTIFQKAIGGGDWYDNQVSELLREGVEDPKEIYEALAVSDIQQVADLLLPVYERTLGEDGFVSLEVSPELARDTEGTVAEAWRLWRRVGRPNVMIKVPATREGLPAISALLARGVNVNVTLIFGLQRYQEVLEAHVRGLQQARESGLELDRIASVASFFVSRVDTLVDRLLELKASALQEQDPTLAVELKRLQGKAAIANAKVAYRLWQDFCQAEPMAGLLRAGARPQRLLWASTSTKNPAYPDTLYVEELIGPRTVNTMPPETIAAFLDHGQVRGVTLLEAPEEAEATLAALAQANVKMKAVAEELEAAGVELFARSFRELLDCLAQRVGALKVGV